MSSDVFEIRGNDDFQQLKPEWNDLLSRSPCNVPFLRHEWISQWSECFSHENERTTIIASDGGKLLFGLPLIETSIGRGPIALRVLQSSTNSHSFRFHYLADQSRSDVLQDVLQYLHGRRNWHMLQLSYVPLGDYSLNQFLRSAEEMGFTACVKPMFDTAVLLISGSWEDHQAGLKKSFKKTMRRQDKRMKELGDVCVETLEDRNDVLAALPEAFDIERRSWKGESGSAIACQPNLVQFYTALAESTSQLGWMRLSFLKIGDARTAFEFAFEYDRRFFSIKIGFDSEQYGALSVGRRLVHESVGRCFQQGLQEYDFVGAYSSAQEYWQPMTRPVGWVYIYNQKVLSKLHHLGEFRVKPLIKNVIRPKRD